MDKLKPILAQKFWILCAFALLLPLIGWFLGRGKLEAAIQERITKLNGLNVPNGSTIPNENWMTKAQLVQDERQKRLDTAADFLWQEQQKYMTWPSNVRGYVQDLKFEDELDLDALERYRSSYNVELQNLWMIVDPYRYNEMTQKEEGKVALDISALATLPPDDSIWPTAPPTSKEVWYLQEEMWLLKGLLESVRNVNDDAGADSIVKAPIKQISLLQLQGGDMAALAGTADPLAGDMGMEGGDMGGEMPYDGGMGAEGSIGAAAGGLDFDLAEEVGPNTLAVAAEVTDGGEGGEYVDPGTAMPGAAFGGEGGMMAGGNPLLAEKRYVDDDPTAPFKTRAFKMQVTMDHRYLPELLASLTNSPFPVRILRVHWAEMNPDPRFGGSATLAGAAGMSESGSGMGSGYSPPGMGMGGGRGGSPMGMGSLGGGMRPGMSPMGGRGGMSPGLGRPMGGLGGGRGGSMPGMRPMGGRGGAMPGMSPMGGRGGGGYTPPGMGGSLPGMNYDTEGGSGYGGDGTAVDLYSQAMMSPYLAQVVIGGLTTIYRSPQEMAAGAVDPAADPAATDPAATDPAATDPAATDPAATDPAATEQPVDPAADTEPAPAVEGETPADGVAAEGAAPAENPVPTDGATPAEGVDGAPAASDPAAAPATTTPTLEAAPETAPADPPAATPPDGSAPPAQP